MTQRILIIDDNELNLELAAHVLERDGLEVCTCEDAARGAEVAQDFRPDAVLLDIQMRPLDGLAVLRLLRADPRTQNLRVIAYTAFAMAGDETRLLASGFDGYLAKPINVSSFAAQVRALAG